MKVSTLEILWHGKEPVLSVDCHAERLVTAGADCDVKVVISLPIGYAKFYSIGGNMTIPQYVVGLTALYVFSQIWRLGINDDGTAKVEFLASLNRHTKSVNVVRFSPNGKKHCRSEAWPNSRN